MYRVLLVDDDPIVLIQLRRIIDWNKLECELIAEAANGEEAIKVIEQYQPQIVITDISMPGINGIDLINYIQNSERNIQVIAISAFDDFEYVRKSLKGGAEDYLLKHQLTSKILEGAITEAVSKLETEVRKSDFSIQEKREHLLYLLLHSAALVKEAGLIEELQLSWLRGELELVLGETDTVSNEENGDIVYELIDETIRYYQDYQILFIEEGMYLIIFRRDLDKQQEILAVVESVQMNLKRFCDVDMSFVISEPIAGYQKIHYTVEKCKKIMKDCYFKGETVFIEQARDKLSRSVNYLSTEDRINFLKELEAGKNVEELFQNLLKKIDLSVYSRNQVQFFFVELIHLFVQMQETLNSKGITFQSGNMYEKLFELGTVEEMKKYFVEEFIQLQKFILKNKESYNYSEVVKEAIQYIDKKYKDKISLADISKELAVSPSYLSRIFKKDTGINIVNYVNQVRMKQAKILIGERKYSLNEVATEIGINNYNYFYMLFKETYGYTPSDYIKNTKEIDGKTTK